MPKLTKHGKKRISERVGATDNSAVRNARKALRHGIKHVETFGDLHQWLDGKFLSSRRKADQLRIYSGRLYVFSHGTLVTVYDLPKEISAIIEECVEPDIYDRYMTPMREARAKKVKTDIKGYDERLLYFRRMVLLNDLRDYVDGRFPVEISGVGLERKLVKVYYIPTTYDIPDLKDIVDYIKSHTYYREVHLIHKKGMDGYPEYNVKADYEEIIV